jgi:hypothetical protein
VSLFVRGWPRRPQEVGATRDNPPQVQPPIVSKQGQPAVHDFVAQMSKLKAEKIPQRLDADDDRIRQFEDYIGAALPDDYRSFLSHHSGVWVSATCPISEPTPFGDEATIETFYGFMSDERRLDDLYYNSDLFEGAPVAIPIAEGGFGSRIFLFVSGELAGGVYFYDGENRCFWPDDQFYSMYENLSFKIQAYLDLRKNGELPQKPEGMENFYRVADDFTSFIESCKYWDLDAEDGA